MRYIIYGAGAIGSIIGGHLFRTNHNVVLVANPRHVDRIRESGLRLITPDKTYILKVLSFERADKLLPFTDEDLVLLTAKSQHTLKCLGQLKNAGAERTLPIFCCQNSIWNEPLATRIFDKVYGMVLRIPGLFLEPGTVVNPITGNAGFIEVGLYPRGSDRLSRKVSKVLRKAGFAGGINEWVMKAKAAKCLSNLANAFGAITDGREGRNEFIAEAMKEAMDVWREAGIEWEDLTSFNKRVASSRGMNKMPKGYEEQRNLGSSWQSLMRKTGNIEAEHLNGDVVNLGKLLGIMTPYNEVLWQVADEMARNRDNPGKYNANHLLRMVERKLSLKC